MLNGFRLNWSIYESDILYFGGAVHYTGNVITKSYRSRLEEAIVTLRDTSCIVYMERFRKGNAAICKFVDNGRTVSKIEEYPEACEFMELFDTLTAKDSPYLEFAFIRRVKQYGTLIMQLACCLVMSLSIRYFIVNTFSILGIGILLIAMLLLCKLGSLYSCHRMADPREYHPIFFDGKDD